MSSLLRRYPSLFAFIALVAIWEVACRVFNVPSFVLPPPTAIVEAAAQLSPARWLEHLMATLEVAILGYAAAIAVALPLAIAVTRSALLSRILMPWLVVVQSTPVVAIAPIIVVALGAGTLPRIVITTLIAFFPIALSTATGLASAPAELIELSRSLKAPAVREYTQIRFPFAVSHIFSALKVGITLSVIGSVVAEFVAADRGLGYLILVSTSSFKVSVAFAALVLLVSSSLVLYGAVVFLHRHFFPWSLATRT